MKFVNRENEQTYLKKIIDKILAGESTCVWIEGTRGSGKSYFLRYIKNQTEMPLFYFEEQNWMYKCTESNIDNNLHFFVEILTSLQLKHPKEFNDFLFDYFENIYSITWVEALAYIFPNIKMTEWAKDIINKPLEQVEHAKQTITNKLHDQGLKKCLAELVIYMLTEVEKEENVVFCIDDACWLDENSINTIKLLLNIARCRKDIHLQISLIILTRPSKELTPEKDNYYLLEETLKEIYDEINYIQIKNFDYSTTQEYIKLMDKQYVRTITHSIYEVTKGNPQDLFETLKFSDGELGGILCSKKTVEDSNYISSELIIKLEAENTYSLPIICAVSLLQQKMQLAWLMLIIPNLCDKILGEKFNIIKYDHCMNLLREQDILEINGNTLQIVHDSLKEAAIEYIQNNGEYIPYLTCITDTLKTKFGLNNTFYNELMYLYSKYNSSECFNIFVGYYDKNEYFLDSNIIKIIAQCLSKDLSLYSNQNLEKYIIPIILERCIQLSFYDLAYNICSIIYYKQDSLSIDAKYKYLIYFSKILIDKGLLETQTEFNAIDIIKSILCISNLNQNMKLESYLLAMSAYEHILDFEKIKEYNELAKAVVSNEKVAFLYHAMFLRNQGLVQSHCELEENYLESIEVAGQIEKEYEKKLMLGTCHNNLGLHYLYTANTKDALKNFEQAKKYLDEIGYDTFRVLNNIAICHLLENRTKEAYNVLLQAKALNLECIFEKLCIQSNLAILEFKLSNFEIAKGIVKSIIEEYNNSEQQTQDYLVYSSAMVNMAYFYYKEEDYVNAAKFYKQSLFFDYRYNDEFQKQKRKEMLNLSLFHMGVIDEPQNKIDLCDNGQSIFNKMYAPIAFAYYII